LTRDEFLAALTTSLRDLTAWLTERNIPHAIVGGVAVAIVGRPRITDDIDAVVLAEHTDPKDLLADAIAHGFAPRRPDAAEFARESRVLQLKHAADGILVDVALGILPFEREMIDRAKYAPVGGVQIPVATPEDLIVMKILAYRGKDVADIESILDANAKVDLRRVRYWAQMMSAGLESPEIIERLNELLSRRGPSRRKKKKRKT